MVRGFRQRASNMGGLVLRAASCSAIAADNRPENPGWRQQAQQILLAKVAKFNDKGKTDLLLSGYPHHGRNTYTPERIREFNENAWGLGIAWDDLPCPGAMEKFCTKNMF